MNLDEQTVSNTVLYEGPIFTVCKQIVRLPDGKQAFRDLIHHNGGTAVIAFTQEGCLLAVRQYRKALGRTTVEIPAGKCDRSGESPLATIQRELEEETHHQAQHWQLLTAMYLSPGILDEVTHIYLATGVEPVTHALPLDEGEFVEPLQLTYEEAVALCDTGEICDAKTLYALQYWQLERLKKGK